MKILFPAVLAIVLLCLMISPATAGEGTATNSPEGESRALAAKISEKLKAGKTSAVDLADELKALEALVTKHQGEKTEDVAMVVYMEAMLYKQVLHDDKKGEALFEQLVRDYPDTKIGRAQKTARALVPGAKFPEFTASDTAGRPVSLANCKGRLVVIEFWATRSGPCVVNVPDLVEVYAKHHTNGLEIIGISLDTDKAALENFTAKNKMTWPQIFDGPGGDTTLAAKYGVTSIPATYLLDGAGNILANDLHGGALGAVITALMAKK